MQPAKAGIQPEPRKEPMTDKVTAPAIEKSPRHIVVATRHLLAQREKAITAHNKAAVEVKQLTMSLEALGWSDALAEQEAVASVKK
jgi:hypothetical protein